MAKRQIGLNSIHEEDYPGRYEEVSDVLLEKFNEDDIEENSAYDTDVDAFLNGINQQMVAKREQEREAARWKPSPRVTELESDSVQTETKITKTRTAANAQKRKSPTTSAGRTSQKTRTSSGSVRTSGSSTSANAAVRRQTRSTAQTLAPSYDRRSSRHTSAVDRELEERKRTQTSISSRSGVREKKTPVGLTIAKYAILLILFVIVVIVCIKGYNTAYDLFNDLPMDSANLAKIEFPTTGKETDEEMAQKLYQAGIIDDPEMYVARCKLYDPDYRQGSFKLSKAYNMEKITNILSGYNYSNGTIEEEVVVPDDPEAVPEGEGGEPVPEGGEVPAEGGEPVPAEGAGGDEWYDQVPEEY